MKKWLPFIGILVLMLGISDYLAYPILSKVMFKGEELKFIAGREIFMYLIVGLAGVYSLNKIPREIFFNATEKSKRNAYIIGVLLITLNTIIYIISFTKISNQVFLDMIKGDWFGILGLSLRSGISEELLFRFFLINSIIFIGSSISSNVRRIKLVAILLSALLFIFIHPLGSALITLTSGIILGFIYFELGLIPVIIFHSLSNLIPFSLVALGIIL